MCVANARRLAKIRRLSLLSERSWDTVPLRHRQGDLQRIDGIKTQIAAEQRRLGLDVLRLTFSRFKLLTISAASSCSRVLTWTCCDSTLRWRLRTQGARSVSCALSSFASHRVVLRLWKLLHPHLRVTRTKRRHPARCPRCASATKRLRRRRCSRNPMYWQCSDSAPPQLRHCRAAC